LNEVIRYFGSDAAVYKALLDAAQFGELGEDGPSAKGNEAVYAGSNGGVGGDSGEAIGGPAFRANEKFFQGGRFSVDLVGFFEVDESFPDGAGDHVLLGGTLLLLVNEDGFGKLGSPFFDFLFEGLEFGIFATQSQDGGSGYIGAGDVASKEATQGVGVLACAAAADVVGEELDSINVGEEAFGSLVGQVIGRFEFCGCKVFGGGSFANHVGQMFGIIAVGSGGFVAESFVEGVAKNLNVFIFAEDHGDEDPVVGGSHSAIIAMVAIEGFSLPGRDIRCIPLVFLLQGGKVFGFVLQVCTAQEPSCRDLLGDFTDCDPVHSDVVARLQSHGGEFLFWRDDFADLEGFVVSLNGLVGLKLRQGNVYIVLRVNF